MIDSRQETYQHPTKPTKVGFGSREEAIKSLEARGLVIGSGPFKNRVYQRTKTGLKLVGKLNSVK